MTMAQTVSNSSIVDRTDDTNRSTKSSDSLRPHYYTTFQNSCCDSKANSTTSTQNKDLLLIPQKFKDEAAELLNSINQVLIEDLNKVTQFTNVIPNKFLEKNYNFNVERYLIDRGMFKTMNDAHIINWIPKLKMLYPIRTSGNGNCLLHAVLIAMVGIHDLNLYLRDQLAQFMDNNKDLLKNHWRIERLKSDKTYGISSVDSELDDEWNELCDLVRYENSEDGQTATQLKFLEAVHIFSTSNMLHRPIIVLSEDVIRNKVGEAISVNDLFGIYLPILSTSRECIKEPIVLAYDRSHFCPLQTSDICVGRTSDNLLPLYLSINHTYDKTLLPIRFLGNDVSVEHSNDLLHDYLQIQKVEHSFDSNSPPLTILCAELGGKHLSPKDNFFLLYYKYVIDFFEIQKPKAIEEERRRERQRELENYVSRHISYDTNGRSIVKQDPILSSSSSIISPRSNNTIYDIQSRNQNNPAYEQQYLYDDAHNNGVYRPYDGAFYVDNPPLQPQQSKNPPDYAKTTQRDPNVNDTHSEHYKQLYPTHSSDNISNLNNNGKLINSINLNIQEDDSKFKRERQQNITQIPVQVITTGASSSNYNSLNSERRSGQKNKCVLCDRLFDDVGSIRLCPECDYRIHYSTSHRDYSSRPTSRLGSTNIYLPAYDSGYSTVLSPTLKTRTRRVVTCPHCKHPNMNYASSGSEYCCSVCKNLIPSSYLYY